ncbi:hypothetical protein GCM10010470_28250 [Saccharopolyspora taberi]|uniref:ESAT-6-like protein n=1 Tax=Saccharopolyspora taberi TaxID=60895 RepID=A0ABN3VD95_9PSEU
MARVYEEKARGIQRLRGQADRLFAHGAYGDCNIGRAMDQKFTEKVEHPQNGVMPILEKMQNILRDMAQTYRTSARDMQNTDEENARNLERNV